MGKTLILSSLFLLLSTAILAQDDVYKEIQERLDAGEYEEALELSEQLRNEGDDRWKLYRARALVGLGKLQEAEPLLNEYLKENPSDRLALITLSNLYLDRGEFRRALELLKGLEESPERDFLLGMSYYNLGLKELADFYFNASLSGEKESVYVKNLRGSLPKVQALLSLALGYDTNPAVAPQEGFISKKESTAYRASGVLRLDDGVNKLWLDLSYTAYSEVSDFNTLIGTLRFKRLFGRFFLPMRIDYTTLGGDFYRAVGSVGGGYQFGQLLLSANAGLQDYTSFGTKEDKRDGFNLYAEGKYHFAYGTPALELVLRMGYESTEGKNWRNAYLYPYMDANYDWKSFNFGFSGGLAYYSFTEKHSIYGKKRRDIFISANPYVRYLFGRGIYGELSYIFTRNSSNIEPFDYSRHEVYASVGGVF
ncbi:tetratricopeptide repeat protein [Hydrogenivirga sp. 128-5-R1-1]|uniref:tetratricopeptide repeat protein n=1 Tax=Hydrogenivirga sp. 128-5-R1-1 TaxID=392423 RepID=UPI00015F18A1|nr:tetratricopeptide repeat protein [Hydrogenivirga sp. 128-5-R1-1]EDP75534.1 hypothetical protein HG1285_16256 [Hydrogenivirga sp. 128-5-R1-1]